MKYKRSKIYALFAAVLVFVLACPATVLAAAEEEVSSPAVYATFWSLVPPVVAIVLALITKEVYSSLFVGILVGAILYSGGNFEVTVNQIFFRRNDQRAVLIQQRRYPGVPGNSWNHGVPDEPCWRICRIRTLGKQAHQNKSGRRACYDFTWRSDFY